MNFRRDVVLNVAPVRDDQVSDLILFLEDRAYPRRFPESLSCLIDEGDFLSFAQFGLEYSSAPSGISGPSNGVPRLVSYGNLLSASLSCMFRKMTQAFRCFSPPLFSRNPTEPEDSTDCVFGNSHGS